MKVFKGVDELEHAVETHLGYSDWHFITQQQIETFAQATGDFQWVHVDADKAAQGPYGTTIAHGYLTLSLEAWAWYRTYVGQGRYPIVNTWWQTEPAES